MTGVPFNPGILRVPVRERDIVYGGRALGAREPSLVYHLAKRVVIERQWALGTDAEEYLSDLRRAVLHSAARVLGYVRGGEHIAATCTPTDRVIAPHRRGPRALPNLLVIYSADRCIIVSG